MLRRMLIIVAVLFIAKNLPAAVIFESQDRQMSLVAQAGSSQVRLNASSMDFSPLILDQSIKALGPGCQVQVAGQHVSDIEPGSISYDYSPRLLAGTGTGTPVVPLYASYSSLISIIFSVTDSPLDFNISHSFYSGYFSIAQFDYNPDYVFIKEVANLDSPPTVTLQPGRYCLRAGYGLSKDSTSADPFYMDFEGLSSLRVTYNAAAVFLPEPSTLIIFSLLGGIGIFFGWRKRRFA